MSFGSSVGDCVLLAQLAWSTYQGAKKACGDHDELTREVSSLYKVLNRLRKEISNPESLVNKASDDKRQELEEHAAGCDEILKTMNNVLTKYNGLTGEQRRGKKLWQKIKFGNGQTKNLADIRIKLSAHTSAIMMSLNLCSLDSLGRVEATLGRVEARSTIHGEQLRGIRKALHWVTANMAAASGEGSVWTSYTNDDQIFWRELRRELAKEGYRSSTLQRHKRLIKNYVEELGNRGVFDDIVDFEEPLNQPDDSPDFDGVGTRQSTPTSELSMVDFIQDGDDVLLHSLDGFSRSRTGLSEVPTELPITTLSEALTDHLQPVDKPSDDHDGGDQHNHASDASHVGDTAGQDENDIPEIALMETTSVGEVAEVIENPSDALDFESVEELNLETTSIGNTLCIQVSKGSTIDEIEAEIEVLRQLSLSDSEFVAENQNSPLSVVLVDEEDVDDLDSLDSLISDGNDKQMTPMSESSIDTPDHIPEPQFQEYSLPATVSSESLDSGSTLENGMELTAQVDSSDEPERHSHDNLAAVLVEPSHKARSPYAVQIEEVLDEEFVRYSHSDTLEELSILVANEDIPQQPVNPQERSVSQNADVMMDPGASDDDASNVRSEARPPASVEEVLDEDFSADAHPNVSTANITFDYGSDTGATVAGGDPVDSSPPGPVQQTKPHKRVRFADTESIRDESKLPSTKWAPEDLRFIFFRETRDFNSYRELQESYQALFDETEGYNSVDFSKPENTTTFITHSPYTPPATMFDLQYYRVPASYYHTFWHPQRVPIYLHGNVFDGISLTSWIYNWTAYTFKDNSYQMNAVRRLGKTVVKLGSALSDIEHAKPAVKAKLPRDLYDESGVLWADLENIINDIMSEAEDRLEASKQGGRLEVEFVSRFCHELIAGNKYYRPIEKFRKKTEAWCKKARFHPEFIMLWELWES